MKELTLITVLSLLLSYPAAAQPEAKSGAEPHSSFIHRVGDTVKAYLREPVTPKPMKWKAIVVPAALISYGTLSVASGWFDEVNLLGRRWASANEDPDHKTSIDDYSEYVPAIAVYGLNI